MSSFFIKYDYSLFDFFKIFYFLTFNFNFFIFDLLNFFSYFEYFTLIFKVNFLSFSSTVFYEKENLNFFLNTKVELIEKTYNFDFKSNYFIINNKNIKFKFNYLSNFFYLNIDYNSYFVYIYMFFYLFSIIPSLFVYFFKNFFNFNKFDSILNELHDFFVN